METSFQYPNYFNWLRYICILYINQDMNIIIGMLMLFSISINVRMSCFCIIKISVIVWWSSGVWCLSWRPDICTYVMLLKKFRLLFEGKHFCFKVHVKGNQMRNNKLNCFCIEKGNQFLSDFCFITGFLSNVVWRG